jgi:hypothetical protein
MHEYYKEYDSGELAPGEKECYDGAVTCGEVGRAIRKLTTRGNQDLRRTSTKVDWCNKECTTNINGGFTRSCQGIIMLGVDKDGKEATKAGENLMVEEGAYSLCSSKCNAEPGRERVIEGVGDNDSDAS